MSKSWGYPGLSLRYHYFFYYQKNKLLCKRDSLIYQYTYNSLISKLLPDKQYSI